MSSDKAANERKIEALNGLRDDVLNTGSIGETALSELFYEARTTTPNYWNSVTAFIDIDDGVVEIDRVKKLMSGRWDPQTRSRHDMLISVNIIPFMESRVFRDVVTSQIDEEIRHLQEMPHANDPGWSQNNDNAE